VNDAPVALAVSGTVSEDGPTLTVAADFTDVDASDTHTFTMDTTGTLGSVTNVGDGTFVYDPRGAFDHLIPGETATDTFTYTVDDGQGGTSSETVTVTVTGQVEAIKLTGSDGAAGAHFGNALAINGSGVLVVGARYDDNPAHDSGAVYVYTPNGSLGFDEVKLAAFDFTAGTSADYLGYSVDLNDSGVVVAGAMGDNDKGFGAGAAYVFTPDGTGGYTQVKLTPSDGSPSDGFGFSIAVNGSGAIVVGSRYDDDRGPNAGAAYVYVPDGLGGYDEIKLTTSDTSGSDINGDQLGWSVDINDAGVVIAGAMKDNNSGFGDVGALHVFAPNGDGTYTETKLVPSDGAAGDQFGRSSAINANGTIAVGSYFDDDLGSASGAVYVYQPDGVGGYSETKILASDGGAAEYFGQFVTLGDDGTIVVGTMHKNGSAGATYVYVPDGAGGYSEVKLTAPDGAAGDYFGSAVSINDDGVIAVGAMYDDDLGGNSGSAYVYTPNGLGGYVGPDGTVYQPTSADLAVTGTTGADTLAAGTGDDELNGLAGDDLLAGGAGSDVLTGGTGADVFQFKSQESGHDVVTDFDVGAGDLLEFDSATFASFSEVMLAAQDDGTDTTITIDADTSVRLDGVVVTALSSDDFSFV